MLTQQRQMYDVIQELQPLPDDAIFLGLASDGLPVLLNSKNKSGSPLLVIENGSEGYLHKVATMISVMGVPSIQYAVITKNPDEWNRGLQGCAAVFGYYEDGAENLIFSASTWAQGTRSLNQALILFIDDLSIVEYFDFEAKQCLKWLLLRGPAKRVWPFVSIKEKDLMNFSHWTEPFRNRIYAYPDCYETMEGRNLLKFWMPNE